MPLVFHEAKLLGEWCGHLRISRKQTKDILSYCRYFTFQQEFSNFSKERKVKIEKFSLETDPEILYFLRKFLSQIKELYGKEEGLHFIRWAYKASKNIHAEIPFPLHKLLEIYKSEPLVLGDLEIKGQELMALGYKGAAIGDALHQALDHVLRNPESNTKRDIEALLAK